MATEEYGTVLEVSSTNLGTSFLVDAAVSATTLFLTDVSMFEEVGGRVYIDSTIYNYTAIDYDLNIMTLLTGLVTAAVADETIVEIFPPAPHRTAMVAFSVEEGEAVRVVIPHFFSGMPDGKRPTGSEETVLVEERNPGELYVKDVMSKGMIQLGDAEDLDDYVAHGSFIQMTSAWAASGFNYPVPYAGILEVLSTKPPDIMVQRYSAYRTVTDTHYPSSWVRVFGHNAWSPWQLLVGGYYYEETTCTTANTFTVSTVTDVLGTSISLVVRSSGDIFDVDGVFEVQNQTTAGGDMIGRLSIDGVEEVKQVLWNSKDAVGTRRTCNQRWRLTGLAVGTRILKLRVTGPIGVYQINTTRTTLTVRQV